MHKDGHVILAVQLLRQVLWTRKLLDPSQNKLSVRFWIRVGKLQISGRMGRRDRDCHFMISKAVAPIGIIGSIGVPSPGSRGINGFRGSDL